MDATVRCIEQPKKPVQTEPCAAWFPRDTQTDIELFGIATGKACYSTTQTYHSYIMH